MESRFEQRVSELHASEADDACLSSIVQELESVNSELSPSFISQSLDSLHSLEQWAWQLLGQSSHSWLSKSIYSEFLESLATFNRNLILFYDDVDRNTKGSLLIPTETVWIDNIVEQVTSAEDDNDPFIRLASLWLDNFSFFLRDNPEQEISDAIRHIIHRLAHDCVMTDRYRTYVHELNQATLEPSIFTAKQLFYLKSSSFCLSSYLFATTEQFPYKPEEIFHHIGEAYTSMFFIHTETISSWSSELLACVTYLMALVSSCCWWGGNRGEQVKILIPTEEIGCQHIDALLRVISYKQLYPSVVSERANDKTILLDGSLFIMKNIAQNQDYIWFLRSKTALPGILLPIAETSICHRISLCIYIILSDILSDERLKELKISEGASIFFFSILEGAWHHPLRRYKHVPVFYLLRSKSIDTDLRRRQYWLLCRFRVLVKDRCHSADDCGYESTPAAHWNVRWISDRLRNHLGTFVQYDDSGTTAGQHFVHGHVSSSAENCRCRSIAKSDSWNSVEFRIQSWRPRSVGRFRWNHVWHYDQLLAQGQSSVSTVIRCIGEDRLSGLDWFRSVARECDGRHGARHRTIADRPRLHERTVPKK